MAVGWPTKVSYVDGDVYSASDVNDTNGTINLIKPTAKGDLFAGSAANTYTKLAVGANNTILTADSTAATGMKWGTGGLNLISTTSFSAVSSQTVSGCFSSTYNHYRIVISLSSSAGGVVSARFGVSGTPTTTNYYWGGISRSTSNTTVTGTNGSNVSTIQLSNDISGTGSSLCVMDIASPNETFRTSFISQSQSVGQLYNLASGWQDSANQFTDFVILPASGNITGKVSVYGYGQ